MPSEKLFYDWLLDKRKEEFLKKYEEARRIQAETNAERMVAIANDHSLDVRRARLIIDVHKWNASKLLPKKYGDKMDVTSDGEAIKGGGVQIIKIPDNGRDNKTAGGVSRKGA